MNIRSILNRWKLTEQELTLIIDENPSLRGFLLGYIGEYKLKQHLLANPMVTSIHKPDDHDRKHKNDLFVEYRRQWFTFEVKSLQTNSISRLPDGTFKGIIQVDASDKRAVMLPDGTKLETTCLLRGEFDVLAVNLFQFREEWAFAFALNRDLPSSTHKAYTPFQREQLLATSVKVAWPINPPFVQNPFALLDTLIAEKSNTI